MDQGGQAKVPTDFRRQGPLRWPPEEATEVIGCNIHPISLDSRLRIILPPEAARMVMRLAPPTAATTTTLLPAKGTLPTEGGKAEEFLVPRPTPSSGTRKATPVVETDTPTERVQTATMVTREAPGEDHLRWASSCDIECGLI